ncbi:MAG: homocysteine S-methyltransferase family protein [Eubacteriales bacterium]
MTKKEFYKLFSSEKPILLDGATGTEFQRLGMPIGVSPEKWALDNSFKVYDLQKAYVEAGSKILYTPTFGANRIKLKDYGFEDSVKEFNKQLVYMTKEAVHGQAFVAGNISATGEQIYPIGDTTFEEIVEVYKEQVEGLLLGGVDLFVIETMMSLQEARAGVIAIKELCDLPIMVSLTYDESGHTLYGTDPLTALITLQNLGADSVGFNCSTGPDKMIYLINQVKPYAKVPIFAKPNAGLPKMVDGISVYDMDKKTFAKECKELVLAGANIVGGCCGTNPEYIYELNNIVSSLKTMKPLEKQGTCVSSERKTVLIELEGKTHVVGERINPTGKKYLQEELKQGKLDAITNMALEQIENGATILDVNLGMNGIDEKEMMIKVIQHLSRLVDVPLCIDSSHIEVIEVALRVYPGRALVNSISLEKHKVENLLPIVKKYGAAFILLPLSDKGLPKNIDEKIDIIHEVEKQAKEYGFQREDIIIDGLVTTVATNPNAALETLQTIEYCKEELKMATILGLSNISFGLPERKYLNSSFLSMAISKGLTAAIANPSSELLMMTTVASDVLNGKDMESKRFIKKINLSKGEENKTNKEFIHPIYEAVVKGNKDGIINLIQEFLAKENNYQEIINTFMIPAINKVGELFDEQVYFLPQLIASAETMKKGIEYLEPLLKEAEKNTSIKKPKIVMATVEGDIHDIGKNLVVLMLKNHGFDVIDLGKDVSSEIIIQKAKDEDADIIGLSALMTTTMIQMKNVINMAKELKLKAKIVIGGAVITESFAKEIGADGYSRDASDAVNLIKTLLKITK